MAISEQPPRTQPEQKQTPDATVIAYHVAAVEDNLQQDRQAIDNPYEVCLISIHDAAYQTALPSTETRREESL